MPAFLKSPLGRWGLIAGIYALLVLADEALLGFSVPLLDWIDRRRLIDWGDIRPYGSIYATVLAAVLIYFLAPAKRRLIVPFLACVIMIGLAVNALKPCIGRIRPDEADRKTIYVPFWSERVEEFDGAGLSTPSGETALATANAYVLSSLFPAGRAVFYIMAVLVGLARVERLDHFLSDVFLSLVLGHYLSAMIFPWLKGMVQKRRETSVSACGEGAA